MMKLVHVSDVTFRLQRHSARIQARDSRNKRFLRNFESIAFVCGDPNPFSLTDKESRADSWTILVSENRKI